MFTSAVILGKLLEFALTKLLGSRIDLALNEKKRAAAYFMKLHAALSDLETLGLGMLRELTEVLEIEGATLRRSWMLSLPREVSEATARFQATASDMRSILQIYDPVLSNAVAFLLHSKLIFGDTLKLKTYDNGAPQSLLLERPSPALMKVIELSWNDGDISQTAAQLSSLRRGEAYVQDEVLPGDKRKIRELHDLLRTHLSILRNARLKLAELIKKQFSIEDVLYVSGLDADDSNPYEQLSAR